MNAAPGISPVGAAIALLLAATVILTLWWMLHPPSSLVQRLATQAETQLERLIGSIIVVFAADINSGPMMALAARLARREKSDLHAVYVLEVPFTLPPDAAMPSEERAALDALGAAEAIAMRTGVNIRTDIIKAREIAQAVLDLAKRERANLIMLGSYLEGKYTGAPLGRDIEQIAANAKCDVLIGVEGKHGTLLVGEGAQPSGTPSERENTTS